jgi:cysteine synthase A
VRWASERLGRRLGGSTGTNLVAALAIIAEMREAGRGGSIVTLLCDSGLRYTATYFDDAWIAEQGIDLAAANERLAALLPR